MAETDLGSPEVSAKILNQGTVICDISSRIVSFTEIDKNMGLEVSLVQRFESYGYLVLKLENTTALHKSNAQGNRSHRERPKAMKCSKLGSI